MLCSYYYKYSYYLSLFFRKSHRVTVWGDDGINLRKKLEKEEMEPIIIILTNTKLFKSNSKFYYLIRYYIVF